MEGGDVEYWRIDEQCGLQEEDEKGIISKTGWALSTGLRLWKKIAITGIVVSSAPLVLPPLITICVLGFVVLVPVGVFLGSYACTEKLMSKLLPFPAPPLLLEHHSQAFRDRNQVEEFGEELYGRVYEMKMEREQRIELVSRGNEEGSQYVEKHDDKKGIGVHEHLEEDIVEYLEGEDEDKNGGISIDEDLEEGYEEDAGEYLEGEHEDKNGGISIDEDLEEGYKEDIGEYLEEGEHEEKNEISIDEDLEEGYEEDIGEYLEEGEHEGPMPEMNMETERGREENFEHKSVSLLGNIGSSMKEDEEDLEKPSTFEEEEDKEKDTRSSNVDENPNIGTEAKVEIITVAVVKETELAPETEKQGNGNAAEQVMVSEEKIWEQISAIRGILGYTAAPRSSTVDELKALFILTGVEPPSPFEDPSDLADVDEKLRLLMSIVGAK